MLKRSSLYLLVGLMLVAALAAGCTAKPAPTTQSQPAQDPIAVEPTAAPAPTPAPAPTGTKTADVTVLKIKDLKVGTGATAKSGQSVTVNYTGWLADGTKFDSSLDSGQPFTFNLGAGEVIKGWDEGVAGMKVGGTRKLIIPPSKGYGDQGAGNGAIPPGATLVFDVELLGVK